MTKFCKDCKYFSESSGPNGTQCNAPKNLVREINVVDGVVRFEPRWYTAQALRRSGPIEAVLLNRCGIRARWFEPKVSA